MLKSTHCIILFLLSPLFLLAGRNSSDKNIRQSNNSQTGLEPKSRFVRANITLNYTKEPMTGLDMSAFYISKPEIAFEVSRQRLLHKFAITEYNFDRTRQAFPSYEQYLFRCDLMLQYELDYMFLPLTEKKFAPYIGGFLPLYEQYRSYKTDADSLFSGNSLEVGICFGLSAGVRFNVGSRASVDINLPFKVMNFAVKADKTVANQKPDSPKRYSYTNFDSNIMDVLAFKVGLGYRL